MKDVRGGQGDQATFYIVGIGPGDPELLTLKAYRLFEQCRVVVAPKARREDGSTALNILSRAVDLAEKKIYEVVFPMKKIPLGQTVPREVSAAWEATAEKILALLDDGEDIVFPTLGDPGIYSTGYYLYETLLTLRPDIRVICIPGISAMSSCSASTGIPLCLGDDRLAVVPATFGAAKLRQVFEDFDAVVLMKVHKVFAEVLAVLEEAGLLDKAIYVEKSGTAEQRIVRDLSIPPSDPHYFSTIIVRKKGMGGESQGDDDDSSVA